MLWAIIALIAAIVLALLIAAYDFLHGQSLLRDLAYEQRILRSDLAALDRSYPAAADRSALIISLTSIPSRLPSIEDTLKSLLLQTRAPAEIRLYLPGRSLREGRDYDIPQSLLDLQSVTVRRCERDFGPATKFIPALQALDPDQALVVVDDDRIYPPNFVADLERAAQTDPNAAFCFSGWLAPPDLVDRPTTLIANILERPPVPLYARRQKTPRRVDVMQGFGGYLVRPRFFDLGALTNFRSAPPTAWQADDVWVSAHCAVPKYVIPSRRSNFQPWRRIMFYKRTSLGRLNRAARDEDRTNSIMLRYFRRRWLNDAGCEPSQG